MAHRIICRGFEPEKQVFRMVDLRFTGVVLLSVVAMWVCPFDAVGATLTVRDDFSAASFSNNDGPDSWAAGWIEIDPQAGGVGPSAGQVQVSSGFLHLDDYPDTGGEPSLEREVDLTGMVVASLRFEWTTSSGVDTSDEVVVEVSSDGGGSWGVLETITGVYGAVTQTRSFNITAWVNSETRVRFRITNSYGGDNEAFSVNYVQIEGSTEVGCNDVQYRDNFDVASFGNNDGPDSWSGDWIENDPASGGAGPSAGNVRMASSSLRLDDYPDTGGEPSAARQAFLTGASTATFRLGFDTASGVDNDDAVAVEVSSDGGASWHVLETITNISGTTWQEKSFDITTWASSETQVRFRVSNKYGGSSEYFYVGYVEVEGTCVVPVELVSFTVD